MSGVPIRIGAPPPSARHSGTAAGHAVLTLPAGRLSGPAAGLASPGTLPLCAGIAAALRQLGLPGAELALVARIEAARHRRAGLAQAWIAKARAVAGPGAVRHRPDPDERTAPGRQLAATEAVTPIGRERAAE